jgi:hypothetical protein
MIRKTYQPRRFEAKRSWTLKDAKSRRTAQ